MKSKSSKGSSTVSNPAVPENIPESKYFLDRMKRIQEVIGRRGIDIDKTAEHIKALLEKGITHKFGHHPHVYPRFEDILLQATNKGDATKMSLAVLKAFEDLKLLGSVTAGMLYNELYFSSMSEHDVIQKILVNIKPFNWDPNRSKKKVGFKRAA